MRRIPVLVLLATLLGAGTLTWSTVGGASSLNPVTTTATATYATHTVGAAGKRDWHAQLAVTLAPGWYTFVVESPAAPTCWYAHGTGTVAWPAGDAPFRGVLHVVGASGHVVLKCANGHGLGPMFVTVTATEEEGTP